VYGFGWLINGVLFMIWICYANYLVEKDIFSHQHLSRVKSVLLGTDILTSSKNEFSLAARMDFACRNYATLASYPRKTLVKLYTALQTLTCLQEAINEHLGLLPFFWLCELFLSTCLRITQVALLAGVSGPTQADHNLARIEKSVARQIEYHLEYFIEYLTLTVFYVGFIAIVEYFASQRVSMFQLEASLLESVDTEIRLMGYGQFEAHTRQPHLGHHSQQQAPLNGFHSRPKAHQEKHMLTNFTLVLLTLAVSRKYIKSRYMAWCKFDLNYRLVFAFVNAAAPFSVMILQLHG